MSKYQELHKKEITSIEEIRKFYQETIDTITNDKGCFVYSNNLWQKAYDEKPCECKEKEVVITNENKTLYSLPEDKEFWCPNCKYDELKGLYSFCPECGIKLKWEL